jgi:small multidrug resistance pump
MAAADDSSTAVGSDAPPLLPWMRTLLQFAGGYNLLAALGMVVFYHEGCRLIGMDKPSPIMPVQLVGLLVGLFGVGYWMVARRPLENRGVLWLGFWSKLLGSLLSGYHVARGTLPPIFIPLVTLSDVIYLPPFFIIARRLDRLAIRAGESPVK